MSNDKQCTFPHCDHLKRAIEGTEIQEQFLHNILSAAPGIFYVYDIEERKNVYLNDGYEHVTGYTSEEVAEMGNELWRKVMHPDDFERIIREVIPQYVTLKNGTIIQFECRVKTKQNVWIWLECKEQLLLRSEEGFPKRVVGTAQDITKRKQAEEELLRYRNHLEEMVAARTAELRRSNEDLEQFAYIASHDLREPLAFVSSSVGALAYNCKLNKALSNEELELVDHNLDALRRMQTMIKELLEYSRVGTRSKKEVVDCQELLHEVLTELQSSIKEANADIVHNGLPKVRGDRLQLQRVFQNLITNAIKYRGNEPLIVDISHEDSIAEWTFCIKDNGVGIPKCSLDKLFKMFHRLHNEQSKSSNGSGIGLSICKRIIQHHGGRMWVESEEGQGSTFYFTLPKMESDEVS